MESPVKIQRITKETSIDIKFLLRGSGNIEINTTLGYFDHFLTLFAFWGNFDLIINAKGDTHVDAHHLIEDVGLALGEALSKSLGDKKGIKRMGWAKVPMDEALCEVVVDLSGRPYLVFNNDTILPPIIFSEDRDIWREFFKSFSTKGGMNLHINFIYGKNGHHLIEAAFKALGLAIKEATTVVDTNKTMSTKGLLE